jgi:hypothetical protein
MRVQDLGDKTPLQWQTQLLLMTRAQKFNFTLAAAIPAFQAAGRTPSARSGRRWQGSRVEAETRSRRWQYMLGFFLFFNHFAKLYDGFKILQF